MSNKRFVDRRTSVLLRRLKDKEALLAEVDNEGKVSVRVNSLGSLKASGLWRIKMPTVLRPKL